MNIHDDFEEFLRLLAESGADFVIVGGYAVAFHGYVRATRDIDVLFRNDAPNRQRVMSALKQFGIPSSEDLGASLSEFGSIVRLGVPPVQIELINALSGVDFEQVWSNRVQGQYGSVSLAYLSLPDLIINKRASGRLKDLADVDELGGNRN